MVLDRREAPIRKGSTRACRTPAIFIRLCSGTVPRYVTLEQCTPSDVTQMHSVIDQSERAINPLTIGHFSFPHITRSVCSFKNQKSFSSPATSPSNTASPTGVFCVLFIRSFIAWPTFLIPPLFAVVGGRHSAGHREKEWGWCQSTNSWKNNSSQSSYQYLGVKKFDLFNINK